MTRSPPSSESLTAEEVAIADLVECRRRLIGRDVSTETATAPIGPHDHRESVPTDDALDPTLQRVIPRALLLLVGRNGVHVRGARVERQIGPRASSLLDQRFDQEVSPFRPVALDHLFEGVFPLLRLLRVDVAGRGIRKIG